MLDLTNLSWTKTRESSGTAGSYLKSYSYSNGKKIYYKLSYYDDINQLFGYEAINEIIAARIMDLLNINHLNYSLIHAKIKIKDKILETYLNSSYDFKKVNESKITFENFYELNKKDDEDIFSFSARYNFLDDIYNMMIIDYLILNRDRHGANIEVLYNHKTNEIRLAPLFDQGLSFLSPKYLDLDIRLFDINEEKRVNSFIASSNLYKNLFLIPKDKLIEIKLDYEYIFNNLYAAATKLYIDKCIDLLKIRLERYEDLRNKK